MSAGCRYALVQMQPYDLVPTLLLAMTGDGDGIISTEWSSGTDEISHLKVFLVVVV